MNNSKTKLAEIQNRLDFSDIEISRKIGIEIAELSAFRSGNATDKTVLLVNEFVDKIESKVYPTRIMKIVDKTLDTTFNERAISVTIANSGAGKTFSIERYTAERSFAIYVYVPEVITKKYLLTLLSQYLDCPIGASQMMYENICEALKHRPTLLVLDEADRLEKPQFEILRDLWKDGKRNLAISFIGDETLRHKLSNRTLKENMTRIYRRVKYYDTINIPEVSDVKLIIAEEIGRHKISNEMIKSLARTFQTEGGIGSLINLISLAKKTAERNDIKFIDDEIIDNCIKKLIRSK